MSEWDLETIREQNIAKNKAQLAALGVAANELIQVGKPRRPAGRRSQNSKTNKRKAEADSSAAEADRPSKAAAVGEADGGLRRSGRNAGKKVNYKDNGELAGARSRPQVISEAARKAEENEPRESMNRTSDP